MNRMKLKLIWIILLAGSSLTLSGQEVGVNFNQSLQHSVPEDLNRVETTWVRGFLRFFPMYNNPEQLNEDPDLDDFLELQDHGFKTILSIKYNFHDKAIPNVNSEEMANYKDFMQQVLDRVWGQIDIIVVGNEPFIESRSEDRNTVLVDFYQEMTRLVNAYRENHSHIPIYFGAFNRLDLPHRRYEGVKDMLEYVKNTSWMDGVDLHIHHKTQEQMISMIDYAQERIRTDQKIIITEFSLVWYWKDHMDETISEYFADYYDYDPTWKNYEYIDYALKNPRAKDEWSDFLKNSDWFVAKEHYLWDSYQVFKDYPQFHVATYSYRITWGDSFDENSNPWLLNSLFTTETVEPDPVTGEPQLHYAFFEDFLRIQEDSDQSDTTTTGLSNPDWSHPPLKIINPVDNHLTILNQEVGEDKSFFVLNLKGQKIHSFKGRSTNVTHLSSGLYLLVDSEHKKKIKFIKR